MKRGNRTHVKIDGDWHEGTYLGKGKYSIVFRVGNRAVIYTKDDCSKEVMAMFQHTRMMHLPEMIRHDPVTIGKTYYNVFSSPIYKDVKKKDGAVFRLAMKMIHFYVDHYAHDVVTRNMPGYMVMQKFVDEMSEAVEISKDYKMVKKFPRSVINALQELIDVGRNCGDQIGFDFHLKNFGVNDYGVLIFRDLVNPLTHEYR